MTSPFAAAGGTQEAMHLERLIEDVGRRATTSTEQAAASTTKVVTEATGALRKAATQTRQAIAEEEAFSRKAFGESVAGAKQTLVNELRSLLGGQDPQLLTRLQPVVDRFGSELTERSERHTAELFEKATKALDPDDPTSPLARHRQAAQKEHDQLIKHLSEQHEDLKKTVVELTTTVRVQQEAAAARVKLASVTPLKGGTYEDKIHALVTQIAVGLGDEYRETGRLGGAIHGNNKKGDGVLTVEGGVAQVVLEMSDSDRRDWNDYLAEAERNRAAQASIGLVPSKEQNGGQGVRRCPQLDWSWPSTPTWTTPACCER